MSAWVQGKHVLVAGATGLIGANAAQRLHQLGAQVLGTYPERPPGIEGVEPPPFYFSRFEDCLSATKGMDAVLICAAQTFGAKMMHEQPTALVLPNLQINAGLLEACRINRVDRVVFISSSTVYQEADHPVREEELDLNRPPFRLYLGVGWMKRYIEQLAAFYHERYGMRIGVVRPTNVYGPHDKFEDEKAHVLPALIKRALSREDPYVVWGTGRTVKDFIYVEDFVEVLLDVLTQHCTPDSVNVGTGRPITIREVVEVILRVCEHPVTPVYDQSKPEAVPYRMVDTGKLEELFGRRAWTPLETGLSRTVARYRSSLAPRPAEAASPLP